MPLDPIDAVHDVISSVEHANDRIQILERMKGSLTIKIAEIDQKIVSIKRDIERRRIELSS